jgi:hypothetical protein
MSRETLSKTIVNDCRGLSLFFICAYHPGYEAMIVCAWRLVTVYPWMAFPVLLILMNTF